MTLYERLNPRVTPGTMTNPMQRRAIRKAVLGGGIVPKWVDLALAARLRPGVVGGLAR